MPKICFVIYFIFLSLLLFAEGVQPVGNGTEVNPYQIESLDNLLWLSTDTSSCSSYCIQTADIDASDTQNWNIGTGFSPIGSNCGNFTGTYDGDGFTISNLFINRPDADAQGLFGGTLGAILEDIHLVNVDITARALVGGLVGFGININVDSCSVTGSITVHSQTVNDNAYTGGLIGRNSSSGFPSYITNCFTDVDIISTDPDACRIGGITGFMLSGWTDQEGYPMLIENCYSMGSITGNSEIGGLVGVLQSHSVNGDSINVTNSYSTTHITNSSSSYIGGLIGRKINGNETITNSFWDKDTSGQTNSAGGTGKTTAEMQDFATYTDADWDFMEETVNGNDDFWGMNVYENRGYPFLAWQGYNHWPYTDDNIVVNSLSPAEGNVAVMDGESQIFNIDAYDPDGRDMEYSWLLNGIEVSTDSLYEFVAVWTSSQTYQLDLNVSDNYYPYGRSKKEGVMSHSSINIENTRNDTTFTWDITVNKLIIGNGTEENPYQIASLLDLRWLSETDSVWSAHFIQTADIDAGDTQTWNSGAGFSPIGNSSDHFTGNYNGQGYVIDNLYVSGGLANYKALFGYTQGADIESIGVTNADVRGGDSYVGGLVGFNSSSTVSECYSTGNVNGGISAGGLVGYNNSNSTIANCYSSASVHGYSNLGGLVGSNIYSVLNNCYSIGYIYQEGAGSNVGGLVGDNNSTATNSFWDKDTSGQATSAGGTGKTTAEMQDLVTYTDADWDFMEETVNGNDDFWGMNVYENRGYPFLAWQGYNHWPYTDDNIVVNSLSPAEGNVAVMDGESQIFNIDAYDPDGRDMEYSWLLNGIEVSTDSLYEFVAVWTSSQTYQLDLNVSDNYYPYGRSKKESVMSHSSINIENTRNDTTFTWDITVNKLIIGNGTEENPYQIASLLDLRWLSETDSVWSAHFIQTADIDAGYTQNWNDGKGFSPIGVYYNEFTGKYNGQGYTIEGLFINRPLSNYKGLFGYLNNAQINNIGIIEANITGNMYVGILVGVNSSSSILNCYSTGSVSGNTEVGGLVGKNYYSTVNHCHSTVSVTGNHMLIGGFAGLSDYTTINNCYSTGNVTTHIYGDGSPSGGFVGHSRETIITNCYSTGNVQGDTVGGLVGCNCSNFPITNCYSTGNVQGEYVGGLVGSNNSVVNNSFWDIETSGQTTSAGGTGKTTAEMQTLSTYTDAGWDFATPIWELYDFNNSGYPYLAWQIFPLMADFYAESLIVVSHTEIQFYDQSQGKPLPTTWQWDFDNDGTIDSNEQNPSYTYNSVGNYPVSLTVSDGTNSDTETKTDYITILRAPNYLTVDEDTGLFTWSNPGTGQFELIQHDGNPLNGFFQAFDNGYGVVYDVSCYSDVTVEMVDFRHSSYDIFGTWDYSIHIVDWNTHTEIAEVNGLQTTGDDIWEEGIDLGSVPVSGLVGIFLEPMSNDSDDAYPCLASDGGVPDGLSYYGSIANYSMYLSQVGDFLMDIWIMGIETNNRVKAPRVEANFGNAATRRESAIPTLDYIKLQQSAANNYRDLQSYNVYLDGVLQGNTDDTGWQFTTLDHDQTYTAGVSAVYDEGETAVAEVEFTYAGLSLNRPDISITTDSLDFVIDLNEGFQQSQNITINNNGSFPLEIIVGCTPSVIHLDDILRSEWLSYTPAALTIQPGESADITINVDASTLEMGDYSEILYITSNDPNEPEIGIPLNLSVISLLDTPVNVTTSILDNQITITWEEVEGANSYKIFACDNPDGEFIDVTEEGTFETPVVAVSDIVKSSNVSTRNQLSWSANLNGTEKKFYNIQASTETSSTFSERYKSNNGILHNTHRK